MEILDSRHALAFHVDFTLRTPLLLLTGDGDEVLDNTIDKTPDGKKLHINGYVWAGLLRRALARTVGEGPKLAEETGKYAAAQGVSPLWCESSFVDLPGLDSRPGIIIDRIWGANATGALFNEENVPPGIQIPLDFTWFVPRKEGDKEIDETTYKKTLFKAISSALWVINDGIENIGGGWGYGFGRLKCKTASFAELELSEPGKRKHLFNPLAGKAELELPTAPPALSMPWKKIRLEFKIADGQILAIHTKSPLIDLKLLSDDLPDDFVFKSRVYDPEAGKLVPMFIIPGKAVRQALFSTEIERRLRTCEEGACYVTAQMEAGPNPSCTCKRCKWFGSTNESGIIAVLDAPIEAAETSVLHRIQLCEHSAQNMNLFAGEYLTDGRFATEVIIDQSRPDSQYAELEEYIARILHAMMPGNGPAGWHRIGATTACTGQLALEKWPDTIKEVNDGAK